MEYLENDKVINIQEKKLTIKLKVESAKLINEYKIDKSQEKLSEILEKYTNSKKDGDKSALIAMANMLSKSEIDIETMEHNANVTVKINELICTEKRDFTDQPLDILEKNVNSFCDNAKLRNRAG